MIKDVLVYLKIGDGPDTAADFAVSLAASLDAHLTGVAVSYAIDIPPVYTGAFPVEFIEEQRVESERLAKQAVEGFESATRSMGISGEVRNLDGTMGGAAERVGRLARLYDLTIVGQPDPEHPGSEEIVAEAVMFDSGRPLLLVPVKQAKPFSLDRVIVAWDGSRAAARAIAEARPLLHRAGAVEVVVVETGKPLPEELPGADVARHLARHERTVELRRLTPADGESVGEALLRHAQDSGADLLIMGGYGHSRLRQFVLGGVTRHLLEQMTLPVLMAH